MRRTRMRNAEFGMRNEAGGAPRVLSSFRIPHAALRTSRSGVVLLIVLIVVAMLALGAYSFVQHMSVEARAAQAVGRQVQARAAAESGVHYAAAILMDQKLSGVLGTELRDSATMFHGQVATDEAAIHPRERCRFSVVASFDEADRSGSVRYGLVDESAKINLNTVLKLVQQQGSQTGAGTGGGTGASTGGGSGATNPLLYLPNMTPEIADAILDWLDEDDDPRPYGAESDYYLSLNPPYQPRNGPLHSLDELLLVAGVTPRLLYGEDANQNGILDANEDDGEQSHPNDDANGELDRGWLPYLTLYSRESNKDNLDQPRINLNNTDLDALYEELAADPDIGDERAQFIIAYRLFGVVNTSADQGQAAQGGSSQGQNSSAQSGQGSTGQGSASQGQGSQGRSSGSSQGSAGGGQSSGGQSSGSQQSSGSSQQSSGSTPTKTIAGMDASNGAQFELASVTDLIDATVPIEVAGQRSPTNTKSPFTTDGAGEYLDVLLDRTTTSQEQESFGRINVNWAPQPVLMALPGMTEEVAGAMVAAQPGAGESADYSSTGTGWLLSNSVITKQQFKQWEPFITGRSHVYRVQSVGYFEDGGPVARVEAVIDLSGTSPRFRLWRDLTPLGRGFDPIILMDTVGR